MNPSEPIDYRFDYAHRHDVDQGEIITMGAYRLRPETEWGKSLLGTAYTVDADGEVVRSFKTFEEAMTELHELNGIYDER